MPLRLLLSLLAGLAMATAFEPVGFVLGLVLGIAGLTLALQGRSARQALLLGWAFGVGFMFVHLFWIRAVGYDAWLALAAVQSVFFAAVGLGFRGVRGLPGWPVWSALIWVAVETVRGSFPFGGMPWGRLSFAVVDTPWAGWLPWVGATGLSVLLALTGTATAWALLRLRRSGWGRPPIAVPITVAGLAAIAAAPVVIGIDPGPSPRSITVASVQGDVPGDGDNVLLDHRQVTRNHVSATVDLAEAVAAGQVPRPHFVLWPENSTAVDPFRDTATGAGIAEAVAAIDRPVLVGAIVDGPRPGGVLNQGIVWDPETGAGDRYTKRHPVPFGEYIPYRDRIFSRNFGRLSLIPRDMFSGTRIEPLRIDGVRVADAICFDVAYDDGIRDQLRDGADLLVVQTSNAMFIRTPQLDQQFAITRLRAIETGRSVVVASTNGITGIIAADGTVRQRAEIRSTDVLVDQVPLHTRRTPAMLLGAWPARVVLTLAVLALLAGLVPYARITRATGRTRR